MGRWAVVVVVLWGVLAEAQVKKGSAVRITRQNGKVVLGTVQAETPNGLLISNGNKSELVPFTDIATLDDLSVAATPEPAPAPAPVAAPAAPAPTTEVPLPPPPPPPVPEPAIKEEPEPPPAPPPPSSIAIHVNAADALFFGLTVAADFELASKWGVFLEARAMNAGFLPAVGDPYGPGGFGTGQLYRLQFQGGGGGAVGIEKFFGAKPGLRGLYVALATEVLAKSAALYSTGAWASIAVRHVFVVPHARFGFRFRFWSLLLGVGVRAGAGILTDAAALIRGKPDQPWGSNQRVYPDLSAILDLGYFFK